MKTTIISIFILIVSQSAFSQNVNMPIDYDEPTAPKFNMGLGLGIDYGGIGVRATFLPHPVVGIFGAVGYALVGVGYNVGAQFKVLPKKRVTPTLGLMYGYNGIIKVQNLDKFDKLYYGVSLSGGIQIRSKRNSNFFNIELVVPFRDKAFYDDWDAIKQQPNIQVKSEPLPVAFSVGYHFALE